MRSIAFLTLLAGLSGPALADPPAATPSTPVPAPASPAPPAATPQVDPAPTRPDAARVAGAGRLVDLLMPPGTMRQVMLDFLPNDDTILAMVAGRLGIDTADMTREQRIRAVEERGLREDRHFRERFRIMMDVTRRVGSEMMATMEPEMRGVMTTLIARQFSVADLAELETFFRTPVGARYARSSLTMMRDPAWQEFFTLMAPRVEEMQRRLQQEINAATAHLDPAPHS